MSYIHPADPRRDNDISLTFHRAEAAAEMHGAGLPHDASLCGIPHPGTAEYAAFQSRRESFARVLAELRGVPQTPAPEAGDRKRARRRSSAGERPDFREPAYALGRFTESKLLPGYGQASGLRCFMFTTAAVYAPTREEADAIADAHDLRGPRANAYHAELSS